MRFALAAILLLMFADAGWADISGVSSPPNVSLPLDGYCRVGRFMPVRVPGEFSVAGSGILPAREAAQGGGVVPILIVSEGATLNDPGATLHVLMDDQRLVGLVGSATEADAKKLIPDHAIVTVRLDWPLAGSISAWETLDAVVIADERPPDEAVRSELLANGTMIAVKSDQLPQGGWPWEQRGDGWWALRCKLPRVNPATLDSSPLLSAWTPGVSAEQRRNAMLAAAIVVILALAASLRRGRAAIASVAVVAIGSSVAIGVLQGRSSALPTNSGAVDLRGGTLEARDWWIGVASVRAGPATFRVRGLPHPVVTADDIQRLGMRLQVHGSGSISDFLWNAPANSEIAFVSRSVRVARVASATAPSSPGRSPLCSFAQDVYPTMVVVRDDVDPSTVDGWGEVTMIPREEKAGH